MAKLQSISAIVEEIIGCIALDAGGWPLWYRGSYGEPITLPGSGGAVFRARQAEATKNAPAEPATPTEIRTERQLARAERQWQKKHGADHSRRGEDFGGVVTEEIEPERSEAESIRRPGRRYKQGEAIPFDAGSYARAIERRTFYRDGLEISAHEGEAGHAYGRFSQFVYRERPTPPLDREPWGEAWAPAREAKQAIRAEERETDLLLGIGKAGRGRDPGDGLAEILIKRKVWSDARAFEAMLHETGMADRNLEAAVWCLEYVEAKLARPVLPIPVLPASVPAGAFLRSKEPALRKTRRAGERLTPAGRSEWAAAFFSADPANRIPIGGGAYMVRSDGGPERTPEVTRFLERELWSRLAEEFRRRVAHLRARSGKP